MDNIAIQIVVQLLTLVSLIVLIYQVHIAYRQYKDDHDRSRRAAAVELQKTWMEYLDPKTRYSRQLIRFMDKDTCDKFWKDEPLRLPINSEEMLLNLFGCDKDGLKMGKTEILIEGEQLLTFRTHVVSYLNLLEIIFAAWRGHVADREMVEEEFGKNITRDKSYYPLDMIVDASPIYPSIKAFTLDCKSKNMATLSQKRKI